MNPAANDPGIEQRRLARLRSYEVIEAEEDPVLSLCAKMAAQLAGTPLAMVSLIDADWQFIKGSFGASVPMIRRDETFCSRVVDHENNGVIVKDLREDDRFANLKAVTGEPGIRFYAGIPLDGNEEGSIGSLCVMDVVPRELTATQIEQLKLIGKAVMTRIELTRVNKRWKQITSGGWRGESTFSNTAERAAKLADIKNGIVEGAFVNYYQPKIRIKDNKIVGVETLMRWNHPKQGVLLPSEFIALMESTGLIVEVGRRALAGAMNDWRGWAEKGLAPPQVAVNVWGKQLMDDDVLSYIAEELDALKGLGLGENPLSIEVAESAMMLDRGKVEERLAAIRKMGVPVALDDFGVGYSCLARLSSTPLDVLKIDRSLVAQMTSEPRFAALVHAVIQWAHGLEMVVVAEGVETEEEARMLKILNCDQAQGHWYSKPMPASSFEALLKARRQEP